MAAQTDQFVQPAKLQASRRPAQSIFWFAATTLLGAFLVFQVQPVISKCVLPWFGGTPAVWTTCMLFFQVLLFAGYVYAHLLRSFFSPAIQGSIHLILLSIAAWMLPIEPSDAWKPQGTESPTAYLLWMLAAHVGLPYFVLSSTGPLVQAWLSYQTQSQQVYRLYALSNAGSLGALLSYPFLVEPMLSVSDQSTLWSLMFCGFVLVQGVIAIGLFRVSAETQPKSLDAVGKADAQPVPRAHEFAWIALPALASTLLLVVTNHVCQDVAVIPFLWVLPLSLYLLSFVVCFDSPHWYRPKLIAGVTLASIIAIQSVELLPHSIQLIAEASCYFVLLFGVCLLCHGEAVRVKPQAHHLTRFYMLLSAGGAIGGIIVAVLCPMLLSTNVEVPFTLAIVTAFSFLMFFVCRGWRETQYDWSAVHRLRFAALIVTLAPILAMIAAPQDETVASQRNFFGTLQVLRDRQGIRLVHGSTIHGMQRRDDNAMQPTTYYGRESGVGRVIQAMQRRSPRLNIGVVGLGCGVMAVYGRPTDRMEMIEINPAVIEIAEDYFSFLDQSPAEIHLRLGDGRLALERMTETEFDILVLDAFSSDAIPAHLLTCEAFQLYQHRLSKNGVLLVHVSNNHLDLVPLVHRLADHQGLVGKVIRSKADRSRCLQAATWMVIADAQHALWQDDRLRVARGASKSELVQAPLWTDQHHNLVSVLRIW